MNYLFNQNTIFKAEYRHDRANQPVFIDVKDGSYSKTNHLLRRLGAWCQLLSDSAAARRSGAPH